MYKSQYFTCYSILNTFVPWWGDKEVVTEYVAPGIRYIRDAKTGELLAFIEGEEDDDMLDEQADE